MQKSVTFLCIECFLSLIPRRYQLLNAFINLISTLGERSTMLNVRNSSCMISETLKCVYTDVSSNGRSVQKRELYQQKTLLSLKQIFYRLWLLRLWPKNKSLHIITRDWVGSAEPQSPRAAESKCAFYQDAKVIHLHLEFETVENITVSLILMLVEM